MVNRQRRTICKPRVIYRLDEVAIRHVDVSGDERFGDRSLMSLTIGQKSLMGRLS